MPITVYELSDRPSSLLTSTRFGAWAVMVSAESPTFEMFWLVMPLLLMCV